MKVLKKFEQLQKPAKGGGVQVWECEVRQEGEHGVIVTRHGKLGGKMQEDRDVVTVGKNAGKKNETTAIEQALSDAENEWSMKQRRKGYALDVADSKRGEGPMLAQKFADVEEKIDYATALGQPKFDGFRCLARKESGGKIVMVSREFGEFTIPHVAQALTKVMSPGDVFDGELYLHGTPLQRISSWIKRLQPDTAKLSMHLYDLGLPDAPYRERHKLLREKLGGSKVETCLQLAATKPIVNVKMLTLFRDDCITAGYEGAILRWGDKGYEFGARSDSLVKVKKFVDEEFEVRGAKLGRGKYAKCCVFACVTARGQEFDVTAPGSIPEKEAFGKTWQHYVGCMLTVEFQKWTEAGKPFQPIAKWFRDDATFQKAEKAAARQLAGVKS